MMMLMGPDRITLVQMLSDRILVLCEGRPTALLSREEFSHETILEYASPGGSAQPAFGGSEVAR